MKPGIKKTRVSGSPIKIGSIGRLKNLVGRSAFGKVYAIAALVVLAATTILWTVLSAKVQNANADQLINSYLFLHPADLHNAVFPAAHSLLLKWPLFWLISLFGLSSSVLIAFTLVSVLATVAILAVILHRIERRPLVFGTLCLALASVLLLVPTLPSASGLLPVNMAMIATRNFEYVLYIAAILMFVRSPHLHSRRFWLAIVLLALLGASDKLFLVLSAGGAVLALMFYAMVNGWNLVRLTVRWLVGSVVAGVGALGLLWWLNQGVTHIAGQTSAGPYGLVSSFHDFGLGIIYAALGLLTNFGANPASSTSILRDIPHDALTNLWGVSGLSFLLNLAILVVGLWAIWRLAGISVAHNKNSKIRIDSAFRLSLALIWTSLAAAAVFVLSQHSYAGDARYLTIALFALFISLATWSARQQWRPELMVLTGLVLTVGMALAIPTVSRSYRQDQTALSSVNQRNSLIAQAISHHRVDVLVGDYWRVIPTKLASGNKLNVMPLASCTQPRTALTSNSWQTDLNQHSFAYLLTSQGNLTDYPNCTLDQVITAYGRPNASTLIAGSFSDPKEQLLFYDHGAHKSSPQTAQPEKTSSTVLPITLDQLPHTYCSVPTIMNIVAHQDDDLLFMNPDLLHDIQAGHCVRTIYVTAGDSGNDQYYWLGREQGSEAAYTTMIGTQNVWIERIVKLSANEYIEVANPKGNAKVSLIFMHLPDGNLNGQGFKNSHFESLANLDSGALSSIQSIDDQSSYSKAQLITALSTIMHAYQPAEIRTQANDASRQSNDHSDHLAVGRLVKNAYAGYESQQFEDRLTVPLKFYMGYPIRGLPANITDGELQEKEAIFFQYAKFDGAVCDNIDQCNNATTYGSYLTRQYQSAY